MSVRKYCPDLLKIFCCPFPNQVHLLWWPSFCNGSSTLWAHSSRHHQGHCHSLCSPERLPRGPAIWLGLSRPACGKNVWSWKLLKFYWKVCVDLQSNSWGIYWVSHSVFFYRNMRLIRLWGSKGLMMWPRWASPNTTSSAEALSWDTPASGRWANHRKYLVE